MLPTHAGRCGRIWLAALLITALPLGLAACVSPDSGSDTLSDPGTSGRPLAATDAGAPVTLTWWTGQSAEAEKALEGLAADFHRVHPNVTIKTSAGSSTTDELLQKLSAGFAAKTYPDISYAFGSWASKLGESGRTLDITGNISAPEVKWSEFPSAARKTAQPDGRTIGFPAIVDDLGLFYNKTVFDQAGVSYPTADWTWDDFRAAAKKLTVPAKNVYGTSMAVNGTEDTTWHMWPQLWQNGGQILTADEKKVAFDSAAGMKTVSYWHDLAQTDKSVYLDQTGEKYGPMFASNSIGMIITGPWQLYDLSVSKTRYGVTVLPGTGGDHQTVSGPDLWALFDHQDANRAWWSYQFTLWLTQAPQDERWNIALGNLPLRSSAKDSKAYRDAVAQFPGYDVLADNLSNAKNKRPTVNGYVGLSVAYGKAVARLLQGSGDVKTDLAQAAVDANDALAGD